MKNISNISKDNLSILKRYSPGPYPPSIRSKYSRSRISTNVVRLNWAIRLYSYEKWKGKIRYSIAREGDGEMCRYVYELINSTTCSSVDYKLYIILLTSCGLWFLENDFMDPDLTDLNLYGSVDFPTPVHPLNILSSSIDLFREKPHLQLHNLTYTDRDELSWCS